AAGHLARERPRAAPPGHRRPSSLSGCTQGGERMSCPNPVAWATLVDYWAGELDAEAAAALEEHLFGCADCTTASARVSAVTEALRAALPPVVSRERIE